MKLATWNVNSIKVRLPQLLDWLAQAQPDVVCLQELKTEAAGYPREALEAAGYASAVNGQKTYNGVAILSRAPLSATVADIPGFEDAQKRVLAATVGDVRVLCVYCPNGQAVGSEKYEYKLRWFAALRDYLAAERAQHPQLAVAGDFNVAPEDRDVHDPKAWEGQVHVSAPERAAWQALLETGLQDSFRLFEQPEKTFSWWDYRRMGFRRNAGLRIDHLLLNSFAAGRLERAGVDRDVRGWEKPSDHAPTWIDLKD